VIACTLAAYLPPPHNPQKEGLHMEHILTRVALDHDLPVSTVRAEMQSAIHEGFMNPNGHMREVFGDREPTVEEMIAYLAAKLEEVEFED